VTNKSPPFLFSFSRNNNQYTNKKRKKKKMPMLTRNEGLGEQVVTSRETVSVYNSVVVKVQVKVGVSSAKSYSI